MVLELIGWKSATADSLERRAGCGALALAVGSFPLLSPFSVEPRSSTRFHEKPNTPA